MYDKYISDLLYLESLLIGSIHQHIEAYQRGIEDNLYEHIYYILDEQRIRFQKGGGESGKSDKS